VAVFLKDGESFVRMSEAPYELEDVLQKVVADHPEIWQRQSGWELATHEP
jgi:hypothetical protein